ncbi:MAG: hypothetical protein Q8P18_11000 [Pseudomonadota bacterium]|nr:hypothetical protein [Pseudomonadota bacterium]
MPLLPLLFACVSGPATGPMDATPPAADTAPGLADSGSTGGDTGAGDLEPVEGMVAVVGTPDGAMLVVAASLGDTQILDLTETPTTC